MKLLITRHAQSEGNVDKSVYFKMPDWSVPITDKGREQAENVAKEIAKHIEERCLGDFLLITSPYVRAKQTMDIISYYIPHYITFYEQEECLLREREWGHLREEYESFATREERNHLFDFYRRPVGGESFADCYQRAFIFLEWLKKQEYDTVVIVSHGEFIKTLLMIIDNVSVEDFDKIPRVKNCELIIRNY
jgi:broad specificity phosphatase PhoE